MAISIDWPSGVIYVPKADLTPLGGNHYQLDVDWFRLALKDLEDDEEGIVWPKTHNHNPPVTLGGIVFARQVEILAPYTVTFEDGAYGIHVYGGNTNLEDVHNHNSAGLNTANSAGLIETSVGGGAEDWTALERAQIRERLGLDGASSIPTADPSLALAQRRIGSGVLYQRDTDTLSVTMWLERDGMIDPSAQSAIFALYVASTSGLQFAPLVSAAPDANGVFFLTKSQPGLVASRHYYATMTIVTPSGTIETSRAVPVIG